MPLYAGTEADYGNAAVKSLANDIETELLAFMPEAVKGDVKQRKKFIVALARGVINHINQYIEAQVGQTMLNLKADKVVIDAQAIELVKDAMHPGVFGDELRPFLEALVSKFNTHRHGLSDAPDTTLDAVPGLLSTKVKLG